MPGGRAGACGDVSGEPAEGVGYFCKAGLPPGARGRASFQVSLGACLTECEKASPFWRGFWRGRVFIVLFWGNSLVRGLEAGG